MTIRIFQTPQPAELLKSIKVTGLDAKGVRYPYEKFVLFSVQLNDIKAGDIMDLKTYGQVSNKNSFACMFCFNTNLANSPSDANGFLEVTEQRGRNITYEGNHSDFTDTTHYVFDGDYQVVYVNTVIYSASNAAKAGCQLVVDQDYGRSSVMIIRQ